MCFNLQVSFSLAKSHRVSQLIIAIIADKDRRMTKIDFILVFFFISVLEPL